MNAKVKRHLKVWTVVLIQRGDSVKAAGQPLSIKECKGQSG